MARLSGKNKHKEIANLIQVWASKYEFSQDPFIQQLSSAIDNRKNLPFWASLDIDKLFPTPQVQLRQTKTLHYLALLRNMLIFTPVALTWFAIREASIAFEIFTSQNPSSIVNFLEFWQNGYGLLAEEWRISNLATTSASILAVVIFLIATLSFLNRRQSVLVEKAQNEVEKERQILILKVLEYLFEKQKVTNLTLNQGLARTLQDLRNSTEINLKTSKELSKIRFHS